MCGIVGYIGQHPSFNHALLERMNEAIVHRGPDEDGFFEVPGKIGLAMRRLSIIDLIGGQQPIFNEDGSVVIVFNGEIYNCLELRRKLEQLGHVFKTHSDTEVIVHLYEEYGVDCLAYLRGMFAFAIYDSRDDSVLIARDRLGIKPLYYADISGRILFGSELKTLLATKIINTTIDPQALDAYMAYTYIPNPLTIYKEARKLPPAHYLQYRNGEYHIQPYWSIDYGEYDTSRTAYEWEEYVHEALSDAVRLHLISDVPVGVFLSGGIDSGLVAALMMCQRENTTINFDTFTMGFSGTNGSLLDERPLAESLSKDLGFNFNTFEVQPNFRSIAGNLVRAFDEPFADDSIIPSYYLCQQAAKKVKVCLSGLGGDELFAGYHRYRGLLFSKNYHLIPRFLHQHIVAPLLQRLPEPATGHDKINHLKRFSAAALLEPAERYYSYVCSIPDQIRGAIYDPVFARQIDINYTQSFICNPFRKCPSKYLVDRALYADLVTYLPDDILALSDRLSMWHSLELRVPMLDHNLVELCARMPIHFKIKLFGGMKILLKSVAKRYLPQKIIDHRKQGFESPMAAWLRGDLKRLSLDLLSTKSLADSGCFSPKPVQAILKEHLAGRQKHNKILFSIIMFQLWWRNAHGHDLGID